MLPIRDTVPRQNPPIATWTLILINGVIFLFELMLPMPVLERFFYLFGIVPARFTHPDWAVWAGFPLDDYWPFLTSMFLHGGWLHLIGNMWTLWIFGDNVEDRLGRGKYLALYLVSGVAAALVHIYTNLGSQVPTIGASGAIAGVMGAYFRFFPHARVETVIPPFIFGPFFVLPAVLFLGWWFLLQFFNGALSLGAGANGFGGIAWWAHVGGFAFGVAVCLFARRRQPVFHDDQDS